MANQEEKPYYFDSEIMRNNSRVSVGPEQQLAISKAKEYATHPPNGPIFFST